MRTTSNGSGLRLQPGVSRLGLVGGLLVLLMVAAAGCGDVEPDVTVELTATFNRSGIHSAPQHLRSRRYPATPHGFSIHWTVARSLKTPS